MNDNLLGGDTGGGKTFGGGVGGDSDDGSWLGVLSPSTQSEEPKVDALPERLATYRGLSIDEKRRKIREKLEAQRNEKRQVAEKEKMLVEGEGDEGGGGGGGESDDDGGEEIARGRVQSGSGTPGRGENASAAGKTARSRGQGAKET